MAKRFMSIWFPYLLSDAHLAQHPQNGEETLLLVAPERGRMLVKGFNSLAQSKGLSKGALLADCRALFPQLKAINYLPNSEQQLLEQLAIDSLQFSPIVAIHLLDGLLLDVSGCCHLWGGEEPYAKAVLGFFKRKGFTARLGLADTLGAAWAVARYHQKAYSIILSGQQASILAELPPAALQLEEETVSLLQKLGLRRIKDFMSMSGTSLRKRFGPELGNKLQQALGTAFEFIDPIVPPVLYQERLPCVEPILGAKGIHIAVEKLVRQLCLRLEKDGKGLRKAIFKIYKIDHSSQTLEIGTHAALRNSEQLLRLFELKLDQLAPEPGIELFLLEAPIIEQLPLQAASIWKEARQDHQALAALLDRIASKLGKGKTHRYLPKAQHWPERAMHKTDQLQEATNIDWQQDQKRPIMLLTNPETIEVMVPLPDYPPLFFKHQGVQHKVAKADGPERIEPEWWIAQELHRDYYCVEDEQGCRYWIFRLGHYDNERAQWFLHGFFA